MGYRSDVAITILFKDLPAAKLFISKVRAAQPENVRTALTELGVHVHRDGVTVLHGYYESVKWYTGFGDVEGHHTLMNLAEENGAAWRFIRIGEESDDNEDTHHMPDEDNTSWCEDHLWDDSQMVRSVCVNLPNQIVNNKILNANDLPEWEPQGE